MDVGEQAQMVLRLHVGQHLQTSLDARTAKRADAGAIGFVERCLEDDVGMQLLIDAHEFGCDSVE